ncbi:MAG: hypothetical protein ACRD0C_11100 [Acidimicrobiia bacterium]
MRRLTRPRVLAVVGVAALGVAYLAWGRSAVPDHRVPVTGTVIREEPGPPGLYNMIDVEYEVDGKRYTARLPAARNSGADVESFRPGDEVALMRSLEDPARVHRPGGPSIGGGDQLPAPVVIAGVLIIGVAILVPKKHKDRSHLARLFRMD